MRPGELYYLEDVPALHGGQPKGRYVLIVTESEDIGFDEPFYVVACSASLSPDQAKAAVALPYHRGGQASTGLRDRTHAVPQWMLQVRPSQLGRKIGFVSKQKLEDILARLPTDPFDDIS